MPVLLEAKFITGPHGSIIGAIFDLGSTDNYITHSYAKKQTLEEEPALRRLSGIRAVESLTWNKIYMVPVFIDRRKHKISCYGLDTICTPLELPDQESYNRLCRHFGVL